MNGLKKILLENRAIELKTFHTKIVLESMLNNFYLYVFTTF